MTTTKAGRYFLLAGCIMLTFSGLFGQTKYYATVGYGSIYYHNKANGGMPTLSNVYYGLEVDHYLDYHYAFTTGAFFLQGGYDNKASRMVNKFIQVPVGIKMASLGDQLGISA